MGNLSGTPLTLQLQCKEHHMYMECDCGVFREVYNIVIYQECVW